MKRKAINGPVKSSNFYKKARVAVALGKGVYNAYRYGKSVYAKGKKIKAAYSRYRRQGGKSRTSSHYSGSVGSHNDWQQLPLKTFVVGSARSIKTGGSFKLVHAKDNIQEEYRTGYQSVVDGMSTFTNYQLNGSIVSTTISNFKTLWATSPFELNPYSTAPNNAIYTLTPGAVMAGDKLCVKHLLSKIHMVSLSPIAQRVQIYWMLCNHSGDDGPSAAWTDLETELKYLQTVQAVPPALTATTTTQVGFGVSTNPDARPPARMAGRWKTLHKDQFMLQPGDNIHIARKFIYNKIITKAYADEMVGLYQKGWTITPLVVVQGAIVGLGADGEAFPPTNIDRVTYGKCKVGYVQTNEITFAALPASRFDIKRMEMGYVAGNSTNATAIIDADDSEIAAEAIG